MTAVFECILEMSLTAALVIVVVMLIRLLLRKAPRKYSYALWSVAAFRLVCPVSFRAFFSLFNFTKRLDEGSAETIVPDPVVTPPPPVTSAPYPGPAISVDPEYVFTVTTPVVETPAVATVNWVDVVAIVWLAGLAVLMIYGIISYVRLRRRMSTAVLLEGRVWQSDRVQSPFILGFVRPKIYLPFGLSEEQQRYVLAHEGYHIKRLDHIVRPLSFLILAVHWFNPFVWLAYYLMSRDMEMSCDEKVLSGEENIRKAYSTTLLSFAANRRFPSPSPLAFGESGVKGRIKNALNWKKPRTWVTMVAIILCIVVIIVCAADPNDPQSDPEAPYDWTSTVTAEEWSGVNYYVAGEGGSRVLTEEQQQELAELLNEVPRDGMVYRSSSGYVAGAICIDFIDGSHQLEYRPDGSLIISELERDGYGAGNYLKWEVESDALKRFIVRLTGSYPSLPDTNTPYELAQVITPAHIEWVELMINGEKRIYRSLTEAELAALTELLNSTVKDDFAAPPKNAAWAFPTERMLTLCCGGIEYILNLGPDSMSIICRDDRVNWKGEDTWFFSSETVKDFLRQLPEEAGLDEAFLAGYLPYVSVECVYMNPASPQEPDSDSGKTYLIGKQLIAILDKSDNDAGLFFPCPAPWRPLTEEIWVDLFMGNQMPSELSLEGYSNPRYRHLSNDYTLLNMDGELWMIELEPGLNKIGMIWNIYRLACASETVTLAQWKLDVTGDGAADTITVEGTLIQGSEPLAAATISVTDASGKGLWNNGFSLGSDEVADFYLVERDGGYSILVWSAMERENVLAYSYSFVELDGKSAGMRYETLRCGLNAEEIEALDLYEVKAYFNTVQAWMEQGTLLLGERGGEIIYSTPENRWTSIYPSPMERLEQMQGRVLTLTTWYADLTHDGVDEVITLQRNTSEIPYIYSITVTTSDGTVLWREEISDWRGGHNGFYLYERDGKSYLMEWYPSDQQGWYNFSYRIFSLNGTGEPVVLAENELQYDLGSYQYEENLLAINTLEVRSFEWEVNALLKDTTALLIIHDGKTVLGDPSNPVSDQWTSPADDWERERIAILKNQEDREARTLAVWPLNDLTLTVLEGEYETYTIDVYNGDYYLWDNSFGHHGGVETLYFRYEENGVQYLMEVLGTGRQGVGMWQYSIFSIGPEGINFILQENILYYENMSAETTLMVDVDEIRAFEAEVNALLDQAELIAGIENGKLIYSTPGAGTVYRWYTGEAERIEQRQQELIADMPLVYCTVATGHTQVRDCAIEQTRLRMGEYEIAYIRSIGEISTGAVGIDSGMYIYRVTYQPMDYDKATAEVTQHESKHFYLITYEVWPNSMTGSEEDAWYFVDTLSEEELQSSFNTPEMLAQYGDPYLAAVVETVNQWRTDQ